MQLIINGEARQYQEKLTVAQLAQALDLNLTQVAIERNRAIVPKSTYAQTGLAEGDVIEIVQFIGGG